MMTPSNVNMFLNFEVFNFVSNFRVLIPVGESQTTPEMGTVAANMGFNRQGGESISVACGVVADRAS